MASSMNYLCEETELRLNSLDTDNTGSRLYIHVNKEPALQSLEEGCTDFTKLLATSCGRYESFWPLWN